MCGIAGFIGKPGAALSPVAQVKAMTDAMPHRGPDDAGAWMDETHGVALGHRRLSILDLSPEGHQPMASASGRFQMVFNGEVYNFAELRQRLEGLGHAFRGHSDTEIMLAAFEQWGIQEAVAEFVGMFAFAVWDREAATLFLVRDRLGIKPLYYGEVGGRLAFASELKALRSLPGFAATLSRAAITEFLRLSYVPAPLTIYEGIRKLRPGHLLAVRRVEGEIVTEERPFWRLADVVEQGLQHPFQGSDAEATEALERLLSEAVGMRMVADVPLGAFLSGGVDSSLVVALMQQQSSRPVRTFTIGFKDPAFDEAPHARAVATHLGTDHTELYLSQDDVLDVVPRLSHFYDEPFADSSQIPTYLVSALARQHVTVSLSGDGGDELFGGYNRHLAGPQVDDPDIVVGLV